MCHRLFIIGSILLAIGSHSIRPLRCYCAPTGDIILGLHRLRLNMHSGMMFMIYLYLLLALFLLYGIQMDCIFMLER